MRQPLIVRAGSHDFRSHARRDLTEAAALAFDTGQRLTDEAQHEPFVSFLAVLQGAA